MDCANYFVVPEPEELELPAAPGVVDEPELGGVELELVEPDLSAAPPAADPEVPPAPDAELELSEPEGVLDEPALGAVEDPALGALDDDPAALGELEELLEPLGVLVPEALGVLEPPGAPPPA